MSIVRLSLKNFRCFKSASFDLSQTLTIIQGNNGSGKTSLLEALHYACYLRSFRTHKPLDLQFDAIADAKDSNDQNVYAGFSVKIETQLDLITLGVSGKKRSVKINNVHVKNYRELIGVYKVITFIEDDLSCLKGYPEGRRNSIDQALSVQDPQYYDLLKSVRKISEQRTRMLQESHVDHEEYSLWTEQLIEASKLVVDRRIAYLNELHSTLQEITALYDSGEILRFEYRQKRTLNSSRDLQELKMDEVRARRTLYGAHLDDIEFIVYDRDSRAFASRGQQKLAIMLFKIAQAQLLGQQHSQGSSFVFLIDDFLTDFDEVRIRKLVPFLFRLKAQLIITVPQSNTALYDICSRQGVFKILTLSSSQEESEIGKLVSVDPMIANEIEAIP